MPKEYGRMRMKTKTKTKARMKMMRKKVQVATEEGVASTVLRVQSEGAEEAIVCTSKVVTVRGGVKQRVGRVWWVSVERVRSAGGSG
jgi:hypothetical protein